MRLARLAPHFIGASLAAVLSVATLLGYVSPTATADTATRLPVTQMKTMNYFPANAPWTQMWTSYSHSRTASDFHAMASLGANAVRVIVQPYALGYPNVTSAGAATFADMVSTAAANGLSVELTLFDLWGTYSGVTASEGWVSGLLAPYRDDPRISLIELQNEIDPTNPVAMSWARQLLAFLPSVAPGVPRTLTVRSSIDGSNLRALVSNVPSGIDVIDVHLYSSLDGDLASLATAKSIAGSRPVIIGESGLPTTLVAGSTLDYAQAKYYTLVERAAQQYGLSWFSPWTLNDFSAAALPAGMDASQRTYGLRRADGTWKPAAGVVMSMFSASGPSPVPAAVQPSSLNADMSSVSDLDGGFEREAAATASGTLGYWSLSDSKDAGSAGTVAGQGISGTRAAYLSNTLGNSVAVPAIAQIFGVGLAQSVSAKVSVRLAAATGDTQIAIAWFAKDKYIGQSHSPDADNKLALWQNLSVIGTVPVGATSFQVHLKSSQNTGTAYFDNASVTYS